MTPTYVPNLFSTGDHLDRLLADVPWAAYTETRQECFMSPDLEPVRYTYGKGRGQREYVSVPMSAHVAGIMSEVNAWIAGTCPEQGPMNGCFLNLYGDDRQHLGWHADDFDRMDHGKAVISVSFGEPREIWWRRFGEQGVVPAEQRQRLASGSLFLMPGGMQQTHQHRVPKGDRAMGPRVSLTFRAFL